MNQNVANSCPWDGYLHATVRFCENELCAWIEQPSNTWSNLPYIFMGIYLLIRALRGTERPLWPIGAIAVLIGIGSFFFHATSTFMGEVADVGAMFLFSSYVFTFNLVRLRGISTTVATTTFFGLSGLSLILLLFIKPAGIAIFTVAITITCIMELRMFRRRRQADGVQYRYAAALAMAFTIAFIVWTLDISRIACDPDNHVLSGHAVWHIVNSFCFLFLQLFYRQFLRNGSCWNVANLTRRA